jgi:hypothetical protein
MSSVNSSGPKGFMDGKMTLLLCIVITFLVVAVGAAGLGSTGTATSSVSDKRSTESASNAPPTRTSASADASSTDARKSSVIEPPQLPETDGWEAKWAWGIYYSKLACAAGEHSAGSWAADTQGSHAGVPKTMLRAEELMTEAALDIPTDQRRARIAEKALRLYYHGKWLAERNHATASEWRYREASRLARESRRNVLAAHSLGRLGYFLMHWRRFDEARTALEDSTKLSSKSNPLAPYLLGLLDRKEAGADVSRLRAAEDMIINAGEQPSPDLEAERQNVIQEIQYWRNAELSIVNCGATSNFAHAAVCLLGHFFFKKQ